MHIQTQQLIRVIIACLSLYSKCLRCYYDRLGVQISGAMVDSPTCTGGAMILRDITRLLLYLGFEAKVSKEVLMIKVEGLSSFIRVL